MTKAWANALDLPLTPSVPRQMHRAVPHGSQEASPWRAPHAGTTVPVCYMRASFLPAGIR